MRTYRLFSWHSPLPSGVIILLTVSMLLLAPVVQSAEPKTITVGPTGQHRTIQGGINAAADGDEVVVQPGRYIEHIQFNGKSIVVRSTNPENPSVVTNTIIQGKAFDPDEDDPTGSIVTFEGTETEEAMLAGFTIRNGWAEGNGGAIQGNGTLAAIVHNVITKNQARIGGGIHGCDGLILNNTISGNTAVEAGGGLAACQGIIEGNTITGNTAADGGGLYACHGSVLANTITNNSAEHGGGIADSDGFIVNNIIAFNTAEFTGGGLVGCDGSVVNNTIYGNSAEVFGGGMSGCNGEIANVIVWANSALEDPQIHESAFPDFSCIQDWFAAPPPDEDEEPEEPPLDDPNGDDLDDEDAEDLLETDDFGNIQVDPMFVDPGAQDFRLQFESPAIDSGRLVPGLLEDFEGNPRGVDVVDAPRGDGSDYDMGAFEYVPPVYYVTLDIVGEGTLDPEPGLYEVEEGTLLEITATPAEGHMFVHWTGSVAGAENPLTVQVMEDLEITAEFMLIPTFTLTTLVRGEGSVEPESGVSHEYLLGTPVTLSATAAPGWQFQYWEGDASGWRSTIEIVMDSDKTVRAVFVETPTPPADDGFFNCSGISPVPPPSSGTGPMGLAFGLIVMLAAIRRWTFRRTLSTTS